MSEIVKWYSNKHVFVTGGTGFVGKCLVEKLLRDCPDIGTIYLLVRPKNGITVEQRQIDYKNHVVFSGLRDTRPGALDKICVVEGDMCKPLLGLSDEDRRLVSDTVSVVFHSAADVRFDRPIVDAYYSNVVGTKAILELATEFKRLEAFVLVSTAFSQPIDDGKPLEERHYPSPIEPELIDRIIKNVDPDVLDAISPKLLGKFPNTYGYTKCLSEQFVYEYKDRFPVAIARPTIVITAWKEPLLGYTEGIHGINGWCLASGRGVLRSMYCHQDYPCNVKPVDIVVNGIILLAYECGNRQRYQIRRSTDADQNDQPLAFEEVDATSTQSNEPIYFNIAEEKILSWKEYIEILKPNFYQYPYDYALWYPGGSFKTNRLHNFICVVAFQLLPAILLDFVLVLLGHKPFLLRVQRIIQSCCDTLSYYMNNLFLYKTSVYNRAYGRLSDIDKEIFYDGSKMDPVKYTNGAAYGTRLYLAKDKIENLSKARAFTNRLLALDVIVKLLISYWLIRKLLEFAESPL